MLKPGKKPNIHIPTFVIYKIEDCSKLIILGLQMTNKYVSFLRCLGNNIHFHLFRIKLAPNYLEHHMSIINAMNNTSHEYQTIAIMTLWSQNTLFSYDVSNQTQASHSQIKVIIIVLIKPPPGW